MVVVGGELDRSLDACLHGMKHVNVVQLVTGLQTDSQCRSVHHACGLDSSRSLCIHAMSDDGSRCW